MRFPLAGRVTKFSLIGAGVAALGMIELIFFKDVLALGSNVANILQTIISLQLNFILNDHITYGSVKHSNGSFLKKWTAFHATKILAVIFNQLIFSLLVGLGVHYLVSYIVCIVLISIYNFITNENLVFGYKASNTDTFTPTRH